MTSATRVTRLRRPVIAATAAALAVASIAFVTGPSDAATDDSTNTRTVSSHQPVGDRFSTRTEHRRDLAARFGIDDEAFLQALNAIHADFAQRRDALREASDGETIEARRTAMQAIAEERKTAIANVLKEYGVDPGTVDEHRERRRGPMTRLPKHANAKAHANARVGAGAPNTAEDITN